MLLPGHAHAAHGARGAVPTQFLVGRVERRVELSHIASSHCFGFCSARCSPSLGRGSVTGSSGVLTPLTPITSFVAAS